jgi:hypothetical protein
MLSHHNQTKHKRRDLVLRCEARLRLRPTLATPSLLLLGRHNQLRETRLKVGDLLEDSVAPTMLVQLPMLERVVKGLRDDGLVEVVAVCSKEGVLDRILCGEATLRIEQQYPLEQIHRFQVWRAVCPISVTPTHTPRARSMSILGNTARTPDGRGLAVLDCVFVGYQRRADKRHTAGARPG